MRMAEEATAKCPRCGKKITKKAPTKDLATALVAKAAGGHKATKECYKIMPEGD
jgi:hypothetical protein